MTTEITEAVVGKRQRKYPFLHMRIADHSVLDTIEGRHLCPICQRSRKFFCYSCYVPVGDLVNILPKVDIPINIDIIKHKKEIDGKSSAIHAAILATRVNIYTYPNIPDYSKEKDVVLIFPSVKSLTVPQLFDRNVRLKTENNYGLPKGYNMGTMLRRRVDEIIEVADNDDDDDSCNRVYNWNNLPIKRAIFIDSTWNQSRSIFKDERIKCLNTVVLQNRYSQFWRHQRDSPRWYLATIEAIHQFLLEIHVNAWGLNKNYRGLDNLEIGAGFYETARLIDKAANVDDYENVDVSREAPYNGQYDNLMFFFANMYDLIHRYYDHNKLKSYRRPI